jgi:CheY-like chemotaxis protein
MATLGFGKRVPPKHRATPGTRKRDAAPPARSGAHAAPGTVATMPREEPDVLAMPEATPAPAPSRPASPMAPEKPAGQVLVEEEPAAPVEPEEVPLPAADPSPLRVLIVDDNEDVRGLLRIAFARADIEVVGAARHPREALGVAQTDKPDLVLLDVNLPETGGLDLLALLREQAPQVRVVMFSATCGSQVTETAMQRGAMGFVEKGVAMKSVIAHLHRVAQAPEGEAVLPFPLKVYS